MSVTPAQLQGSGESVVNRTGMSDQLKAGLEQLSGLDLSSVRVHYGSSKPEQLSALAYTQGQHIHLAPGQEKHLPHEGWHVVQQMQGRVRPTMQVRGLSINDDDAMEREADVMRTAGLRKGPSAAGATGVQRQAGQNAETLEIDPWGIQRNEDQYVDEQIEGHEPAQAVQKAGLGSASRADHVALTPVAAGSQRKSILIQRQQQPMQPQPQANQPAQQNVVLEVEMEVQQNLYDTQGNVVGMRGTQTVTYTYGNGTRVTHTHMNVEWREDQVVEPGQTFTYEHPAARERFQIVTGTGTYPIATTHSEGGIAIHGPGRSEGCILTRQAIRTDIQNGLNANEQITVK